MGSFSQIHTTNECGEMESKALPVRSTSKLCHHLSSKIQGVPFFPCDWVHQAGPIRQNGKEVLTVPYNLLQLAARGFADCFRKGCEGKALCLCCLLECLQSTAQCVVSAAAAQTDSWVRMSDESQLAPHPRL